MITLFEEYRFIKFRKGKNKKDPNEPFWNAPKKEYLVKKRAEDVKKRAEERERIRTIEEMNRKARELERKRKEEKEKEDKEKKEKELIIKRQRDLEDLERQAPTIEKYINIIINDPDQIRDMKKQNITNNNKIVGRNYGIRFKDKSLITTKYEGDKIKNLVINGEIMSSIKKPIAIDPYNEETWEGDRSPYETLSDLVKNYIEENEIVFK
jgi:hypothetical protein